MILHILFYCPLFVLLLFYLFRSSPLHVDLCDYDIVIIKLLLIYYNNIIIKSTMSYGFSNCELTGVHLYIITVGYIYAGGA